MKETITMTAFEDAYLQVRSREGWIMPDAQVKQLPDLGRDHPLWKEWSLRKASTGRLLHYLRSRPAIKNMLEVGCGNGWLSHRLSLLPGRKVTGLDIHAAEIGQARRVFGEQEGLRFVQAELGGPELAGERFDLVLFAASIQYFPSFRDTVNQSLSLVSPGGEVHLLDSPLYDAEEIEAARGRSERYFEDLQAHAMIPFYHHHSLSELRAFRYRILYHPGSVFNRLLPDRNPFFWIRIQPR